MHPERPQGGQLALYGAAVVFAFTNLFVKLAGRGFSGFFVSGSRFAIGVVLALIAVSLRRRPVDRARIPDIVLRGVFGALSMVASYVAITMTSPGRAVLLANTYPVFVTLFGIAFFGEKPNRRVWSSLALCVAGAVLVVRDGSGANLAGDIIAIVSSVFAGIAVNYVRRASTGGVDPFLLYLSPAILGLPVLLFAPVPQAFPGVAPLGFLVGVGVGAFAAQALMARGYRSVSASKGSVTFFLETGLTVLLGALFVGETLSPLFALGLVFIFAGLWFNRR